MSFDITFIPMPELSLLSLPKRRLAHIISFLDFADYFSIRVTCKILHKASKGYTVSDLAQRYLFDALITFVPDADGHLNLSYHRHHLLCQFICIKEPELLKSSMLGYSGCLYSQLKINYGNTIPSVVTFDKFLEVIKCMSATQVRAICILVKSIITKPVITSLDLSWCCLNTDSVIGTIQLMKQQGLNLKLQHLNLDCNYITSFTCIHRIQDVLDDCKLSIQLNKLHKNRFSLPIGDITRVQAIGNHISNKTMLPKFTSNRGHDTRVTIDD